MIGVAAMFYDKARAISTFGSWLRIVGLISLMPAMVAGTFTQQFEGKSKELIARMEWHETMAYIVLCVSALLFIWHYLRHKQWLSAEKWLFTLVDVISSAIIIYTASLGGNLSHPAGV